jgi:signal transduction histidine kinase
VTETSHIGAAAPEEHAEVRPRLASAGGRVLVALAGPAAVSLLALAGLGEVAAALLYVLAEQTERLVSLTEQLLDLSRLDAEVIRIEPQACAVRARTEELVAAVAGDRAALVRVEIDRELVVVADPQAFDRIVSNLIANALRYGEPPVVVRARAEGGEFRVAVQDHGPGVAEEFVPSLFERFARGGSSAQAVAGTGLGLAIARSYARAHDGDVTYEPARPHGARFQLVLPV